MVGYESKPILAKEYEMWSIGPAAYLHWTGTKRLIIGLRGKRDLPEATEAEVRHLIVVIFKSTTFDATIEPGRRLWK
jgi:hypothetical protein